MRVDKDGKILNVAKSDSMAKLIKYFMEIRERADDEKVQGLMLSENNFNAYDVFALAEAISTLDVDLMADFINRVIEEIVEIEKKLKES